MKVIRLTDEEYEKLIEELHSLELYHWHDDRIHANNCGSSVLPVIEARVEENVLTFFE